MINQREVGLDTSRFPRALRRVLRQDPDVILIGEMRDEETVRTALSAAETGHLVLSTLHTLDAAETINRIVDLFPAPRGEAGARDAGGHAQGHRLPASRAHLRRPRPHRLLRDPADDRPRGGHDHPPGGDHPAPRGDRRGLLYGMQTFDQALLAHVQAGRISMDDAITAASHPHDFKLLVSANGQRSDGQFVTPASRGRV